ncbi:aspartate/glutamate racemase family protein [Roseobacter sp.]|uniref:aspartate/glutamate racemase family protein n=1 Tax=Roseobacter sp. TaxID=1907202 RepID=UPI0038590977
MHIGLIGGIGPAATVVYYQRLTSLMRDRGKKLEMTIVQASADELIANNLADDRAAQAEIYADLIGRLKAAGADCAAITSLGGHFCYDETAEISPLPLVSGVAPLDDYFVAQGMRSVGLIGTEVVMRTRLYGQLTNTRAVAPDGNLDMVGKTYLDMALRGKTTDADRTFFFEVGRRMVEDQGADAVVLAGTDLGLAFDGQDPGYKVVDALDVHIELLAGLATGEMALSQGTKGKEL